MSRYRLGSHPKWALGGTNRVPFGRLVFETRPVAYQLDKFNTRGEVKSGWRQGVVGPTTPCRRAGLRAKWVQFNPGPDPVYRQSGPGGDGSAAQFGVAGRVWRRLRLLIQLAQVRVWC